MTPTSAEVAGHLLARRALEIAAAGAHNLLMVGPPGSGKTMLARRLPGSCRRCRRPRAPRGRPRPLGRRPRRARRRSRAGGPSARRTTRAPPRASSAAGAPPRPGEASLAHHGVLFLDELAEFGPASPPGAAPAARGRHGDASSAPRAPCATRRASCCSAPRTRAPAATAGADEGRCRCPQEVIERYQRRIGGPLMDRIDLMVRVDRVDPEQVIAPAGLGRVAPRTCAERVAAAVAWATRWTVALGAAGSRARRSPRPAAWQPGARGTSRRRWLATGASPGAASRG